MYLQTEQSHEALDKAKDYIKGITLVHKFFVYLYSCLTYNKDYILLKTINTLMPVFLLQHSRHQELVLFVLRNAV